MRHYVRLSQKNYAIDLGIYPLGSCTMKYNPRLNEAAARLPGFADIHPLQPASTRARRAGADPRARPLAARDHRHALRRDEPQGRRAWRALRHDGDQGGACRSRRGAQQGAGAGIGARHQPGDRGAARLFGGLRAGAPRRDRRGGGRAREARGECGRGRGADADQSQHLRHLRAAGGGDRRRPCTRPAATSTATAPTSTPSWARRSRANSASTPCTSTCTRPSPRRMAAAGRAPGRWCCRRRSRRSRRFPSWCATARRFRLVEHAADAGEAKPFGRMTRLPRADGHVRARLRVDALARLRRHAAGLRGRGAERQLRARLAEGHDERSPSPTIRRCTRRFSTTAS